MLFVFIVFIDTVGILSCSDDEIQHAIDSSLILHIQVTGRKELSGSAVAISNRRAVTAVHGIIEVNKEVQVVTRRGIQLSGRIEFQRFESNIVDIAVIVLDEGSEFRDYLPWTQTKVRLTQPIAVIGLKYASVGDYIGEYVRKSAVDSIEKFDPNCALFQASYYNFDGCSGTGVVTTEVDGKLVVVGVHVASHNDSSLKPTKKQKKVSLDASISSAIHGHTAYSLICEIARVPELLQHLDANI